MAVRFVRSVRPVSSSGQFVRFCLFVPSRPVRFVRFSSSGSLYRFLFLAVGVPCIFPRPAFSRTFGRWPRHVPPCRFRPRVVPGACLPRAVPPAGGLLGRRSFDLPPPVPSRGTSGLLGDRLGCAVQCRSAVRLLFRIRFAVGCRGMVRRSRNRTGNAQRLDPRPDPHQLSERNLLQSVRGVSRSIV